MKKLLFIFASISQLFAQRQGLVTDTITRSVNRPASFLTIPAFRLEGRITLPATCNNTSALTISSTGSVGLGCAASDATQWSFSNGSTLQVIYGIGTTTAATFTPGGKYFFSVQRTGITSTDSFQVKMWSIDGTPVGYRSVVVSGPWTRLSGNSDILPGSTNPGLVVHHECWYSDAILDLANAPMPADNVCNNGTLTEIGGFLLDGNKNGISAINMTCSSCASEVYKHSTISETNDGIYPPPAVQVSVVGALSAGNPLTMNAAATVTFDGSTVTSATFNYVSGPAAVPFSTSGTTATVPYTAAGTYIFGVTVPGSTEKQVSLPITSADVDGYPIYISTVKHRTVPLSLNLASVPNATKVVVYMQRPDGTAMAPVTCASFPCSVETEDRMDSHIITRYEYQNSGGTVLAVNTMPPLVKQTRAAKSYIPTKKYPKVWSQLWVLEDLADTPILMNDVAKFWADKTDKFTIGSAPGYEPPIQYNFAALNPNALQNVYSDLASFGASYTSRARAVTHGTTYDQLILHAGQDYIAAGANSGGHMRWKKQDRFDYAEQDSSGAVTGNGIMFVPDDAGTITNCTGTGTTDCTIAGYTGIAGVNTPVAGAGFPTRAGKLYLGMAEPFDTIRFTLSVAGTGGGRTVLWEYKTSGGWATLSVTDGTSILGTTSGSVTFTPPTAWVGAVVHGANSKYWVRATLSGFTAYPSVTSINGDDWNTTSSVSGQPSELHPRGWCATDLSGSDRITAADGKWIYDPTPDSTCTAKFRHQAWHLGIWEHNLPIPHTGRTVGGVYVWGRIVVDKVASFFGTPLSNGYIPNALFIDNHVSEPNILFPSNWRTTTEITTHNGYVEAARDSIVEARNYVRGLFGNDIQVGANGGTFLICGQIDFCKDENSYYPHNGPQRAYSELMGGGSIFDAYQSESSYPLTLEDVTRNPGQHLLVYYLMSDILNHRERNGIITLWDRGNRGPMTIMSAFLFEANQFTYLFPKTGAAYNYFEYDRVFYREETPSWTTTASIPTSLTMTATSTSAVSGSWDVTFAAAHGLVAGDVITNGEVAVTISTTPSSTRITGTGGTVTSTTNGTWTKRTVISGTFTTLPSGTTSVRLGASGQWITLVKINNTSAYSENILMSYSSGIDIYNVVSHTLHSAKPPPVDRIRHWDYWFPALEVEMGDPVGPRYTSYKLACTNPGSGCTDNSHNLNRWQFREFENGYVFHTSGFNEASYPLTLQDQYSPEFSFASETNPNVAAVGAAPFPSTLYELQADGTTIARTGVTLRSAEGKVFLKKPLQ